MAGRPRRANSCRKDAHMESVGLLAAVMENPPKIRIGQSIWNEVYYNNESRPNELEVGYNFERLKKRVKRPELQ